MLLPLLGRQERLYAVVQDMLAGRLTGDVKVGFSRHNYRLLGSV